MRRRVAPAVAWTAWLLAVAAVITAAVLSVQHPPESVLGEFSLADQIVWSSSWLGFGLVGAVIVSRRPENTIGWVLCSITFLVALAVLAPSYARAAYATDWEAYPLGGAAAWAGTWLFTATSGVVVALLLLFPTGRLESGAHASSHACWLSS